MKRDKYNQKKKKYNKSVCQQVNCSVIQSNNENTNLIIPEKSEQEIKEEYFEALDDMKSKCPYRIIYAKTVFEKEIPQYNDSKELAVKCDREYLKAVIFHYIYRFLSITFYAIDAHLLLNMAYLINKWDFNAAIPVNSTVGFAIWDTISLIVNWAKLIFQYKAGNLRYYFDHDIEVIKEKKAFSHFDENRYNISAKFVYAEILITIIFIFITFNFLLNNFIIFNDKYTTYNIKDYMYSFVCNLSIISLIAAKMYLIKNAYLRIIGLEKQGKLFNDQSSKDNVEKNSIIRIIYGIFSYITAIPMCFLSFIVIVVLLECLTSGDFSRDFIPLLIFTAIDILLIKAFIHFKRKSNE